MQVRPVLMLTHDELLWRHWKRVTPTRWLPARGHGWEDVVRWQGMGRRLVVIDAGLPDLPALDSAPWRSAVGPLDILVASLKPSDEQGRSFLAAGAKGYLHSYVPPAALDTALQAVAEGGIWMGATLLARLLRQLDQAASRNPAVEAPDWSAGLTPREKEVAESVARGLSNQAIADDLGITERTVRAHISAVFEKLGVADRLTLALVVHGVAAPSTSC